MIKNLNPVERAIIFATEAHRGQKRKSLAIPYIVHPIDVLKRLAIWEIEDEDMLVAAVLHDVAEDTDRDLYEIAVHFNQRVADIVEELTFKGGNKEDYMKSFDRKSLEALIIKAADRIENVKDFMITSPDYALKYLHKADMIFYNLNSKKEEFPDRFGSKVYLNIINDRDDLLEKEPDFED